MQVVAPRVCPAGGVNGGRRYIFYVAVGACVRIIVIDIYILYVGALKENAAKPMAIADSRSSAQTTVADDEARVRHHYPVVRDIYIYSVRRIPGAT